MASPNHTHRGQKGPPPVAAQPMPTVRPMATERKASNLRNVCHLWYLGQPRAARVPTLTHLTINDCRAPGDFLCLP